MSKQVKEVKEHLERRDILEQRKLKHLTFQLFLLLSKEHNLMMSIYSGENTNYVTALIFYLFNLRSLLYLERRNIH